MDLIISQVFHRRSIVFFLPWSSKNVFYLTSLCLYYSFVHRLGLLSSNSLQVLKVCQPYHLFPHGCPPTSVRPAIVLCISWKRNIIFKLHVAFRFTYSVFINLFMYQQKILIKRIMLCMLLSLHVRVGSYVNYFHPCLVPYLHPVSLSQTEANQK